MNTVIVMMSTYNGEKYVREQIDSILSQNGVNVKLVIRDDGSSDGTCEIIRDYIEKNSNIEFIRGENKGYIKSFMWLVKYCQKFSNCYYCFSDQDDIWDADKLQSAVKMIQKENSETPVMYYSNLKVVDAKGNYIRMANSWESTIDKYKLAMFIGIRGCTMVYNQCLQDHLVKYQPKDISGHDTYVALVAYWIGKVIYDDNAYINYRQTGSNLSITGVNRADKLKKNLLYVKKRLTVRANIHQKNAREVLRGYEEIIPDSDKLKKVAFYKNSLMDKIKLIKDKDFWNFSIQIRMFNLIFIALGKL